MLRGARVTCKQKWRLVAGLAPFAFPLFVGAVARTTSTRFVHIAATWTGTVQYHGVMQPPASPWAEVLPPTMAPGPGEHAMTTTTGLAWLATSARATKECYLG
jgi:hypothetical protein